MEILEEYNKRLHTLETSTITQLNAVLEASFNRLLRRVRFHIKTPYPDPAQRNLAVLQQLRQLIPSTTDPTKLDRYDQALQKLISQGQQLGLLSAADATAEALPTRERIDVSIPLDATIAALRQSKGYLARHGETFAQTSAETVAQGLVEGRPTASMVRDLRERLGVVKSRAETIVRTESLRAYNTAADQYYSANNIDVVLYYATSDDRTCPVCTSRAGNIYKRQAIQVPLHPRCRCYLAPWSDDLAELDPSYKQMRVQHRAEVLRAVKIPESDILSQRGIFEELTPIPLSA